jgi:hypothetical protein
MTRQQLLKKYDALPLSARRQVEELVSTLAKHSVETQPASRKRATRFGQEDAVFGMWRDRADMTDSVEWIRLLRQTHFQHGRKQNGR